MNNELQQKLIEWIESLTKTVGDELPHFISECVTYGFWACTIKAIAFASLAIAIFVTAKNLYLHIPTPKDRCEVALVIRKILFIIGFGIPILISYMLTIGCLNNAIKAKIAPRIYVIDKYILDKR